MRAFADIYAQAAERKGGEAALEALIAEHRAKTAAELAAIPDHRWLAQMSKCVFQAGFAWRVIETKWPGFEAAFHGFAPPFNAAMSDEEFDAHLKDTGIVRNARKILSVRDNAAFLVALANEHGSAAAFFAGWPDSDFAGLLEVMKRRAARLSGETAMRFFRFVGKASFITTRDVTAALIAAGAIDKPPSGKRDLEAVQRAFNAWAGESGRDLSAISRVLAMSTGPEGWGR
ncbi:MAG TPA: DNA-3-methyladenine glycosylase I [Caulobacteraceae bacterium]|jgi:3-methyladenine DNA glycosylase Tag|nr:DNA-3-methyladenine glycosylase I [Caulobacteraceae bacterium]